MKTPLVEYDKLLPSQFEKRVDHCPVAYIPVGALEWHCEHLPLGTDSIKMHTLCCMAAQYQAGQPGRGGVVFPPLFHGVHGMIPYGKAYQHDANMPVKPEFLTEVINVTLTSLEHTGFKVAVVATGHTPGEQRLLVREVADKYTGSMRVAGTDDGAWGDEIDFGYDHAAVWETSLLMAMNPELVDMSLLPTDPEASLEGVLGDDPRTYPASSELGQKAARIVSKDLSNYAKDLLEQK